MSSKENNSLLYALSACWAIGVVGLMLAASAAHADGRVDTAHCNAQAEISLYFGGPHPNAVVYQLPQADSTKIVGLFTMVLGPVPPMTPGAGPATQVYEGFDINDGFTTLFLYDVKGCFVNYLDGFSLDDIEGLHASLGIDAPKYGDHYHQVPNLPGSLPGFSLGGIAA